MAPSNPVRTDPWTYVDGTTYQPDANPAQVTIPTNANIVELAPEDEDVYYRINGTTAGTSAPGFVLAGAREIVGPLDNWSTLWIYQAAGGATHIQWFLQKRTAKGN